MGVLADVGRLLARAERKKAPAMLVITPTRELAMQIQEVCQTIARTRSGMAWA